MKLLIPIFKKLPISTGGSLRNLTLAKNLSAETDLIIQLWKGFQVIAEKKLSFDGQFAKHFFLEEIFPTEIVHSAGIATVEFDYSRLSEAERSKNFGSHEVQLLLKSRESQTRASVLFDLIPDKKPGHTYTPILHAGHSAIVNSEMDSFAVLLNFRPPYLKTEEPSQKMRLQSKSASGDLIKERIIEVPYNETIEISYAEEFDSAGGFQSGSTLNFAGGSSQFAIFTVFMNHKTKTLGIEHSLPPYYYCSGVFDPKNRGQFYARAFSDLGMQL